MQQPYKANHSAKIIPVWFIEFYGLISITGKKMVHNTVREKPKDSYICLIHHYLYYKSDVWKKQTPGKGHSTGTLLVVESLKKNSTAVNMSRRG